MEHILDKDERQGKKDNSWLIVIVVNIIIVSTASLYALFTSSSSLIYSILQSVSGFLVMINSILLFMSFSYHKNYWKKWLLMVIIGIFLFIIFINYILLK